MRQVDDAWNEQMRGTENWRKNKWGAADYDALGGAVGCTAPDPLTIKFRVNGVGRNMFMS